MSQDGFEIFTSSRIRDSNFKDLFLQERDTLTLFFPRHNRLKGEDKYLYITLEQTDAPLAVMAHADGEKERPISIPDRQRVVLFEHSCQNILTRDVV